MKTTIIDSGKTPNVPKVLGEVKTSESQNLDVEKIKNSFDDYQKEFLRLNELFNNKKIFENALSKLDAFQNELKDKSIFLDDPLFSLSISKGYRNEEVKITNVLVISEAVEFLQSKIKTKIDDIIKQITK